MRRGFRFDTGVAIPYVCGAMHFIRGILILLAFAHLSASAELRRFQSKDKTKSFFAELTGYDAKTKRVTVRMKNRRLSTFPIDILSEGDQEYVVANGRRLAIGNDIRLSLRKFQDKSVKKLRPRITDRVYPSGYTISLSNRAKRSFKDISIRYTLYYGVQGYLEPKRKNEEKTGKLTCKLITSQQTVTLKTEAVDIVSGKLEPTFKSVRRRDSEGNTYTDLVVDKPGGRRKDILMGCKVEIVVDGEVVKSEADGTLAVDEK